MACDLPYTPEQVARGVGHIVGGEMMDRCPLALLRDPWTQQMVSLYRWWKRGQLHLRCPAPSAKVIDALDYLDDAMNIAEGRIAQKAVDDARAGVHD